MTINTPHPDSARKTALTASSDLGGHHSTPDGLIAPSGPEIPSRVAKSSWHDTLTHRQRLDQWAREPHPIADSRFDKFADDVRLLLAEQVAPLADMGLDDLAEAMHGAGARDTTDLDTLDLTPAEALVEVDRLRDATGRQVRAIVSLTIRLADVEDERDAAAENARRARRARDEVEVERRELGVTVQVVEARLATILLPIPDDWTKAGLPTRDAYAADMIAIGVSFMAELAEVTTAEGPLKGWSCCNDPAEFVTDAANMLIDAGRYTDAQRHDAADAISRIARARPGDTLGERCLAYVDAVAQALGMERVS